MKALSTRRLSPEVLKKDKKDCRKFGPCGVGKEALYLNSFYLDRRYYVPISSVTRVFKRVAMSKGGFSGKGVFATLPYLVVVYDNGTEKQCIFKHEEHVDAMLDYIHSEFPQIPLLSEAKEKEAKLRAEEEAKKVYPKLSDTAKKNLRKLERAKTYLEARPALSESLTRCAKAKRVNERSNPMYKWAALVIVIGAMVAALYGVYAIVTHAGMGLYFLLFGLAGVLLFSGANVLPTRRNNAAFIQMQWEDACGNMEKYLKSYSGFPVPARYAHPALLDRMMQSIREGRVETVNDAFELAKEDLKSLNSSVTVEQWEYDEIMAIKPMFLVENYE